MSDVATFLDSDSPSDAWYDPSADFSGVMPVGAYKAYAKDLVVKENLVVRSKYLADVYEVKFEVAEENAENVYDVDGKEVSGKSFVGKEIRSKGFFRFKSPSDNKLQPNSGGNREFKELCESLGIKPEEKEVDGKTLYALPVLTPSNCEGMPAIIKIKHENWTNRDGEEVTSPKAVGVFSWSNGKQDLSDLPF